MSQSVFRFLCCVLVVMPIFILSACALKSSRPNMPQPVVLPQVSGNVARYRFEMTQNGQRMTADQFDAWMQANGIHIVKKVSGMPTSQRHITRLGGSAP
ncbi:hypothetical protein D1605_003190 [Xylella fastidiosa subsp. fastidiosa]|uniref:Lipoprotein n=3 Tax=Xylella fastidiosa TaxID=2371 RepID=Q87DU3_XYLFT|nr:hypothetical protein [Xylella fastidiosa]AAO28460.1 conserved hypothetical protein [Xylella fastidiosa Temecula1]ADN63591.1 hypothetical protein XFLM_08435 [Xylella fastidiosa subsp. fastidiosa GB514]ACB92061.1 hypothetical protein XfasM23_0617 [Xylella fastidiosa M23]KGM20781.1 hypothetical protein JT24_03290 [Xylella fastidiosa]MBE0261582.1 hypothetical protein [Xylella fastidiosa subsp. fastidiosa]